MDRFSLRDGVVALALLCVLAAQAVSFAVLLAFPAAGQTPMTAGEAAAALRAPPGVRIADITRHTAPGPPFPPPTRGYAILVVRALKPLLAGSLLRDVRVRPLSHTVAVSEAGLASVGRTGASGPSFPGAALGVADAPFPRFEATAQQPDGTWLVVASRVSLLSAERVRILAAFALSVALLAPVTWFSASRLTRPLQRLAAASKTLGRNPGAPALDLKGPSEVRAAAAAFNDMQDRLARHMEERAILMAAIAHDLRTPLTSLRLRVETAPPPERARMVEDLARLETLVADLLVFVRGGRPNVAREPFDLAELAADCVRDAAEGGADVHWIASPPATVVGEPLALRRALENLLNNAAAYGGRTIVSLERSKGHVSVCVADDGPGLPPDALERVFEPFVRLETSRSRTRGGAGLGLAIARSVARAHGGDVRLNNRSPHGLQAWLELPDTGDRSHREGRSLQLA